jgi:nucleoid DNA-binding protein
MSIDASKLDVPGAIAHVLTKEPQVTISSFGQFSRVGIPARRSISLHAPYQEITLPAEQGVAFRLSPTLKEVLSAGPDSTAAERFELTLSQNSQMYECARALSSYLSCTEEQAHSAIRNWVSSLIKQLQKLDTGGLVAVAPLGFFEVRRYQGYAGINPKTKQPIPLPPKVLAFFLPSSRLRCIVNGRSMPEEVSHEEYASLCGPILELGDQTVERVFNLVSGVTGCGPGVSEAQVKHIEDHIGVTLPALLRQLLRDFSMHHAPFKGLSSVASTAEEYASLVERFGDKEAPQPRAIPFAKVSEMEECAWFACICPKCADDPQVFAAQQLGPSCHEDDGSAMRLSGWIASRVLLHRALTAFEGRVLQSDDSVALMRYLTRVHAGEGINPHLPI